MFCLFLLLLFGVCLALDCPELVCFNEKDKKHCVLLVLASCVCCFVASFVSPSFISRLFDVVRPALVVLFVSCFTLVVHFYYFFHVASLRVGKFFRICFVFVYSGVCLFLSRWLFVSFVLVLRLFICLALVRFAFVYFFGIC